VRVRHWPNDDSACGWIATLSPFAPSHVLGGELRVDCAVVGAGFTGLAIARRLAEHRPDWRIVVLEAQRAGFGASARNSGFIVDVGHYEPALGIEGNRRLARLGRAGRDQLRALVDAHGIECVWSTRGRLHGAVSDVGRRALDTFVAGLEAMGEPYEPLDSRAMAQITGTTYYRDGIRTPGTVTVQPAALARALADMLPPTVERFEESPVRAIHREARFRLEAGPGTILTDRIFLATDGFTPALGFLRRHLFPLFTFASLTRILMPAEQAALGGDPEWGLVPEERMGSTVRRTRDARLLIRNTVHHAPTFAMRPGVLRRVRAIHRRTFDARFPMLAGVELEHTWAGVLGMSLNGAHFFGQLAPGLFAAAGYNGVGVAMGTIAGRLLADLAVGATSPLLDDMLELPRPSWIPPQPLLGVGVRTALAVLSARARAEL